jgi:hypothetical protein
LINRKDAAFGAGYLLTNIGYKEAVANNVLGHSPYLFGQYQTESYFLRVQYDFINYYTGGSLHDQDKGFFLNFGDNSDRKLMINSITPSLTIIEPYNLKSDIILILQKKEYFDNTSDTFYHSGEFIQSYRFPKTEYTARVGYRYAEEDADRENDSFTSHEGLIGLSLPLYWGVFGDVSLTYSRTELEDLPDHTNRSYIFQAALTKLLSEYFILQASYNYTSINSNVTDANDNDPYKIKKDVYLISLTFTY